MKKELIIDTHTHIQFSDFDFDIDNVISDAKNEGISNIIVIGIDKESIIKAIEYKKKYGDFLHIAAAFHPTDVQSCSNSDKKWLEDIVINKHLIGIGETGLDYFKNNKNKELQKSFLKWHINLSIKYNLPFIIHCREAYEDTYEILETYYKKIGNLNGILHSYSGSVEMAKRFMSLGLYISISGVVTFKNATNVKEMVKYIPLDRILIETDCPYLTPVPFRGKRNEPKYLKFILEEISKLKNEPIEKIAKYTFNNTKKVFFSN